MRWAATGAAVLIAAAIGGALGLGVIARPPSTPAPIPASAWVPVTVAPTRSLTPTPQATVAPTPSPRPTPRPEPTIGPQPERRPAVGILRGEATYYCLSGVSRCTAAYPRGGLYAAAGPELRAALRDEYGSWRGRRVTVRYGDARVAVTLIDWCACGGDHAIDLYSDAFRRLSPLWRGVLDVSIRW